MTFYDLPCWSSSLMRLVTWNSNILQNISDNDEPVQFRNREVRNARHRKNLLVANYCSPMVLMPYFT